MFEKYTENARRAVVIAQEEARALNHNYIGSEHLLLALITDPGLAGTALTQAGVTRSEALDHVIEIIGRGFSPQAGHIPFTPRGKAALLQAYRIGLQAGHGYIGSEHLLLGLLADWKSVGGQVLFRCGVANLTVSRHVAALMTDADYPAPEPDEPRFVLSA